MLVTLYGQVRILMRMAADGLLPPVFARVDPRRRYAGGSTRCCAARVCAVVAAFVPIDVLGDFVSIGTLLAFLLVCGGVARAAAHAPGRRAAGARCRTSQWIAAGGLSARWR